MNEPIPLLYTIPNFDTAGSGAALLNVVTRLDRRRFAPSICVLRRGGRLEAEVEALGIPLLEARFTVAPRPLTTLGPRVRQAAAAFRDRQFALWHSYHYLDDYTEPLIARAAGARAWVYTKKNMSWNRRSWYLRSLLARRIAAQNTDMIGRFFAGVTLRKRAVLVPPGVDTEHFRPGVPPRLGLREKLGVARDEVVVGCVANLVPIKGHPILLDAIAGVPGVRVWLAGRELDPAYAEGLRRQAADLGITDRVTFLGGVQDVPALLSELDVFVLANPTGEGCPVALLEAMASGTACVASDIPGSRDVVQDGQNGILVKPRDAASLAEGIRRLAGDAPLRRSLGQRASAHVREAFSMDGEVRSLEKLYAAALGLPDAVAA